MNRTALNCALFLDKLSLTLLVWGYSAGVFLLVAKMFRLPPERISVLCLLSLSIPVILAFLHYLPRRYSEDFCRAWLDLRNEAGGRLLSSVAPSAAMLKGLRVRPGVSFWPLIRRLLLPLAFFAGVWLVPPPDGDGKAASGRGVQQKIEALQRKTAVFAERKALPKPIEKQILEQLKRVEEAAKINPEGAAESVALLQQKLEKSVLMKISAGLQSAEKTEKAAKSMDGKGDGSAADDLQKMMAALERQQAAEGGDLPPEVQKALQEMMQKMGAASMPEMKGLSPSALAGMKPEDLKKLLEALKKCNGGNCKAGESVASMMEGAGAAQALQDLLKGSPSLSGQDLRMSELEQEGDPGRGGVSRGRGDAKLSFGDKADPQGAKFETKVLPPAKSILPGVTLAQERQKPGELQPPEEFRPVQRTGAEVRGSVNAGESGPVLSPSRAQAAQHYFEQLSKPAP